MNYNFNDLNDKVCVITGGSGVIGFSIVKALASVGVKVAIISRGVASAQKKIDEQLNGTPSVRVFNADILDKDSLIRARDEINLAFGPVNILVNCAGGNLPKATAQFEVFAQKDKAEKSKSFLGLDPAAVSEVFSLNFQGTLLPVQVFSEDMINNAKGVILNISSISSFRPLTKVAAYSAAKAGINNLTQWLSVHLADMNIRVNAVAPGFILADQNRFLLMNENGSLTARGNKIISATPVKRFLEAEEISGAVLFLVSDLSNAVTGVVLPVDGGFSAFSGV